MLLFLNALFVSIYNIYVNFLNVFFVAILSAFCILEISFSFI